MVQSREPWSSPAMQDPKAYLTAEQVEMVLKAITDMRDHLIVRMLWVTGARVSELLGIEVDMIDLAERLVTFKAAKKRQETWRSVPIDRKTADMIGEYLDTREVKSPWLFTSRSSPFGQKPDGANPLSRQAAYTIMREACERVGITKVGDPKITKRGLHPHPHTLRHSFAMDWFKHGARPEPLQKILGHTNYNTTLSYMRFTDQDLRKEFDKVRGEKSET